MYLTATNESFLNKPFRLSQFHISLAISVLNILKKCKFKVETFVCAQVRRCRAPSYFVPATKSASWTECALSFDDINTAVINNQDRSGNETALPSPLEIDELCNQVFALIVFEDTVFAVSCLCRHEVKFHG